MNADAYVARQPDRLVCGWWVSSDAMHVRAPLVMRMLMFVLVPRSVLPGVHSTGAICTHRTLPIDPRSKRGTPIVLSVRAQ